MTNFFLRYLEKHDRKRVIMDRNGKDPYLNRFYVFLKDRKKFPFNIFLHQFLRSDPDDLHDHPWPYATLILKGGYWEWVPVYGDSSYPLEDMLGGVDKSQGNIVGETRVWRGPGHFRICRADTYHRIEIEPGVDCWTLFMPGPQKREWGFLTHSNWDWRTFKWVRYDQYIDKRTNTMQG